MKDPINLQTASDKLQELWSPRVIGQLDDAYYVKIAKLEGDLAWHSHDNEDELFLVIEGNLKIEMKDRTVAGAKGESIDAGTRVPLVVKWPAQIPAAKVNENLIDFLSGSAY